MQAKTEPHVAVIGCGHWGKNLVRNFHDIGALVAVHDSNESAARSMAERYGIPVRTLPELLTDDTVTAVAIGAPAETHFRLAGEALAAAKHVFVEKPLALEVSEAEELCRLAETGKRILMVGHLLQYHPAFLKLKDIVRQGKLGRLQYIYSNRLNLGKVRREAPQDISMILSLVGGEPETVLATGSHCPRKAIADATTTRLGFAGWCSLLFPVDDALKTVSDFTDRQRSSLDFSYS